MPVTVNVKTAGAVPVSMFTVAVDVAVPPAGGVTGLGEKETCTPLGREPASKVTAELNEPLEVIVIVSVAEEPAPTLRLGALNPTE